MTTANIRKKDFVLLETHVNALNLLHPSKAEHNKVIKEIQKLEQLFISIPPTSENKEAIQKFAIWLAIIATKYSNKIQILQDPPVESNIRTINQRIHNIPNEKFSAKGIRNFNIAGIAIGAPAIIGMVVLAALLSIPLLWANLAFMAVGLITGLIITGGLIYNAYKGYQENKLYDLQRGIISNDKTAKQTVSTLTNTYQIGDNLEEYEKNKSAYSQTFAALKDLSIEIDEPKVHSNSLITFCC